MKRKIILVLICLILCSVTYATLSARLNFIFNITNSGTADFTGHTPLDNVNFSRGPQFTDGTGANQAEVMWHDSRTLGGTGSETIRIQTASVTGLGLATSTISDSFGVPITIDIFKAIYVKNTSATYTLEMGSDTGDGALSIVLFNDRSDILRIAPGGEFFLSYPDATGTPTTARDAITFAHSGSLTNAASLTYEVIIIGVD